LLGCFYRDFHGCLSLSIKVVAKLQNGVECVGLNYQQLNT